MTDAHSRAPDEATNKPAILFGAIEMNMELIFSSAYNGTLRLYAVDWDTTERRETIRVDDGTRAGIAHLIYNFSEGIWVSAPVSIVADGRAWW